MIARKNVVFMQLLNCSDTWFSFSGSGSIFRLRGLVLQEVINISYLFEGYNIGLFDNTNIFCVNIINQNSE